MEKQKKLFLQAVEAGDRTKFLSFIDRSKSKTDTFDLVEFLQVLPNKDHVPLFESLHKQIKTIIDGSDYLPSNEQDAPPEQDAIVENSIRFIKGFVVVVQAFIKDKKRIAPESLHKSVCLLHDIIMELYQFCHQQQTPPRNVVDLVGEIATVCETWYTQSRDGREHLIPQTISYLLMHAIDNGKAVDIKRIYGLREALMLIDFQDESSITIKQILLSCLIHPHFLHNPEGRKFLSCLFGLSQPFVDQLHDAIKSQLPLCKKSLRGAYAEIYFRAWKTATGPYLHKMEYTCIQDLMTCAVHAANKSVVAGLRGILGYLHEQKNYRGVDNMLTRLYEPIIWRSLKVANQYVRGNAAWLFVDAFPLVEEDAPSRESDETLQRQFQLLQELLMDPTVIVRETAVLGVCQILGKYWEMIPVATSRVLLHKLINDLAFDTSSSTVRAAVLSGVKHLLDNNLSHGTLKVMLNQRKELLHDKTESVRDAFLDLLLAVKSIVSIRFFDIAPVDTLLARLSHPLESPALAAKITALLIDTYCPQDDSKAAVNRCMSFLESDPVPCRVFYSHVHKFVPPVFVCKLASLLFRVVQKKDTASDESKQLTEAQLEAALELIDLLWTSVEPQLALPANESLLDGMHKVITNQGLQSIYQWASSKGKATLLRVASHLPAEKTIPLYEDVVLPAFSALGDKEEGEEDGEDYKKTGVDGNLCYALLSCLYKWEHAEEVLKIANEWVVLPFTESSGSKKPKKTTKTTKTTKRKKTVENAASLVSGDSSSKPLLALKILGMLLQNKVTRDATLSQPQQIQKLVQSLVEYLPYLQKRVCSLCGLDEELVRGVSEKELPVSDEVLLEGFVLYCKLLIHINGTASQEKDTEALKNLLELVSEVFVPAFNLYESTEEELEGQEKDGKKKGGRKRKTSENGSTTASPAPSSSSSLIILLSYNISKVITDFAVLGFAGSETLPTISSIFQTILTGSRDKALLKTVAPYISKYIFHTLDTCSPENWDSTFQSTTALLLKVLGNLPADLQASANFKLSDVLGVLFRKGALLPFLKEVMPLIWESIEESESSPRNPPTLDDVNASTKFVLSSFTSSGQHLGVLAHHLNQFVSDSSDGDKVWKTLQVISLLVNAIASKKVTSTAAIQNVLISIISKLPSIDATTSTYSENELHNAADSLLKLSLKSKEKKVAA